MNKSNILFFILEMSCLLLSACTIHTSEFVNPNASVLQAKIADSELKSGTFVFGNGRKAYLFLPDNFKISGKYKFILFLHGRGAAPGSAGNFGSRAFAEFRKLCSQYGYIVAVPPLESSWFNAQAEKDVEDMLKHLSGRLKMDLQRFYVMGCSMGGLSALVYSGRHAERVISICDVFGPFDLKDFVNGEYKESIRAAYGGCYDQRMPFYESRNPRNYVGVLKNIPILVIHGKKDKKVAFEQSVMLIDMIRLQGGNIELIASSEVGHSNTIINGLEEKVIHFMQKHQ